MSAGPSRWAAGEREQAERGHEADCGAAPHPALGQEPHRGRRAHGVDQREGPGRHQQRRVEREVADGDHGQRREAAERDHGERTAGDLAGARALGQPGRERAVAGQGRAEPGAAGEVGVDGADREQHRDHRGDRARALAEAEDEQVGERRLAGVVAEHGTVANAMPR